MEHISRAIRNTYQRLFSTAPSVRTLPSRASSVSSGSKRKREDDVDSAPSSHSKRQQLSSFTHKAVVQSAAISEADQSTTSEPQVRAKSVSGARKGISNPPVFVFQNDGSASMPALEARMIHVVADGLEGSRPAVLLSPDLYEALQHSIIMFEECDIEQARALMKGKILTAFKRHAEYQIKYDVPDRLIRMKRKKAGEADIQRTEEELTLMKKKLQEAVDEQKELEKAVADIRERQYEWQEVVIMLMRGVLIDYGIMEPDPVTIDTLISDEYRAKWAVPEQSTSDYSLADSEERRPRSPATTYSGYGYLELEGSFFGARRQLTTAQKKFAKRRETDQVQRSASNSLVADHVLLQKSMKLTQDLIAAEKH